MTKQRLLATCLCSWMLCAAAVATAEPRWGTPVVLPQLGPTEVIRLGHAPDGSVVVLRGKVAVPERTSGPVAAVRNVAGDAFGFWLADGVPISAYTPAGGSPDRDVVDIDSEPNAFPAISINDAGDVAAAWAGAKSTMAVVTRRKAAGLLSAPKVLSTPDKEVVDREIVVAPDGSVTAAWVEVNGATRTLFSAQADSAGTWSAPLVVETQSVPMGALQLRADGTGRVVAGWLLGDRFGPTTLRTADLAVGGAWSPAVTLGTVTGRDTFALAVASGGNAAMAWTSGEPGEVAIAVTTRTPGGAWSAVEKLGPGRQGGFSPVVDISNTGHVAVAWVRSPEVPLYPLTRARVRLAGGSWLAAQDLGVADQGSQGARTPEGIAIAADGRALVLEDVLTRDDEFHNRIVEFTEAGTPVPPSAVGFRSVRAERATSGSLTWLRVVLRSPVEDARLVVQQRRGTRFVNVSAQTVSGSRIDVPVRVTGAGRRTFRLRLTANGRAVTSPPVAVVVRRSVERTAAVGRNPVDMAALGNTIWVVSTGTASSTLHRVDSATGRLKGKPLRVGEASVVAAGKGTVWVAGGPKVTAINATTLRRSPPVTVAAGEFAFVTDLAADDTGAWAVVQRFDLVRFANTETILMRLDRRGRVTARVRVPDAPDVDSLEVGGGGVWLLSSGFFAPPSTIRFDPVTGRFTNLKGRVAVGPASVWSLGDPISRLVPAGGPSAQPPLEPSPLGEIIGSPLYVPVPLNQVAVGPRAIWAMSSPRAGRFTVRRIDPVTARVGPQIAVGPKLFDVFDPDVFESEPNIVATRNGAWISVPDHGIIVKVPGS